MTQMRFFMGLAPIVVDQIFVFLEGLAQSGVSLLLVEQDIDRALDIADLVVLINRGQITFNGAPSELDHDALLRSYLGADAGTAEGLPPSDVPESLV